MGSTPPSAAKNKVITIDEADDGVRLDRAIQQTLNISRREARLLISEGRVLVGGRGCRILTRPLRAGTKVAIVEAHRAPNAPGPHGGAPKRTPALRLVQLDRFWLVVDKPAGLLSEPDRFGSPSVLSVVAAMLAEQGQHQRLWLVHRLDASTSGVMVLARTPGAAATLSEQFAKRQVKKHYLAVCSGAMPKGHKIVDGPIARVDGTRHAVVASGRPATTAVTELWRHETDPQVSLVLAAPRTGRTHQIRVHLAHSACPIIGDRLYGGPSWIVDDEGHKRPVGRALLHAWRLTLSHPSTHEPTALRAGLPRDMRETLAAVGAPTNTLLKDIDMHYKARPCPPNVPPS